MTWNNVWRFGLKPLLAGLALLACVVIVLAVVMLFKDFFFPVIFVLAVLGFAWFIGAIMFPLYDSENDDYREY